MDSVFRRADQIIPRGKTLLSLKFCMPPSRNQDLLHLQEISLNTTAE